MQLRHSAEKSADERKALKKRGREQTECFTSKASQQRESIVRIWSWNIPVGFEWSCSSVTFLFSKNAKATSSAWSWYDQLTLKGKCLISGQVVELGRFLWRSTGNWQHFKHETNAAHLWASSYRCHHVNLDVNLDENAANSDWARTLPVKMATSRRGKQHQIWLFFFKSLRLRMWKSESEHLLVLVLVQSYCGGAVDAAPPQ